MSENLTPSNAIATYAHGAGWSLLQARPEMPETIAMPLSNRVAARTDSSLTADDWRTEEEEWSAQADARYRASVQRRPLSSYAAPIRIAVKDTIDVEGFVTRLGLRHHRHYPKRTTPILHGLPEGLVEITAKSATTELNIGIGAGCLNPAIPHIDPAGSSTGSGVATAGHICDLALGTDVLGSVRWPAGHCGVVGLRMTYNPALLKGVFPLSPQMDTPGWVTRTADDLAYLWPLLGLDRLGRQYTADVGAGRIGLVLNVFEESSGCGSQMRQAVETACRRLEAVGNTIIDVSIDNLWSMRGPAWELCARQAWDGYQVWRQWITTELQESTKIALETGAKVSDSRYQRILTDLAECRRTNSRPFTTDRIDAWLLPLAPHPPASLSEAVSRRSTIPDPHDDDYDQRIGYTPIASFAGLPALTMPVARDERDAPLCIQLVGAPGGEQRLIALALQLEKNVGHLNFAPQ